MVNFTSRLLDELEDADDSKEPALGVGATVTVGSAVTYLIVRFVPGIPNEIAEALTAVVVLTLPYITAWLIRRKVWSPHSVKVAVNEAARREALIARSPDSKKFNSAKLASDDDI